MIIAINRNSSPNSTNQDSDVCPRDFGSHGNHMTMTLLETMRNTITRSNVSNLTVESVLQITFDQAIICPPTVNNQCSQPMSKR